VSWPLIWGTTLIVEYASTLPTALTSMGTLLSVTFAATTGAGPPPPLPLPFLPVFFVDGGSSPEVAEVLPQPGNKAINRQDRQTSAFKTFRNEFNSFDAPSKQPFVSAR